MLQLFFDLDKTLWDFDKNSRKALDILFKQTQDVHKLTNFYRFIQTYHYINAQLWKRYGLGEVTKEELRKERFCITFRELGVENDELNDFFTEEYLHVSSMQTNLLPNAYETLSLLKQSGYSMHIITNGFKEIQHAKLHNSSIAPFFDVIVSSEDAGINKPHNDIFMYAMTLAKTTPSQSVMIGDDLQTDILGARGVGMHAIHFDPFKKYMKNIHNYRIYNLEELPQSIARIEEQYASRKLTKH